MLPAFERLLKETMGLDAVSIGRSAVERAVRDRLAACDLHDLDAYWTHVCASSSELQELIDAVVVPETWFFRDREAYAALATWAGHERTKPSTTATLRFLSVPCSSGEEPYSIAMTLLGCGLAPGQFRIDAFDISTRAVALAKRAHYGANSFRGDDLQFRDTYFEWVPPSWRLNDVVRTDVHFQQGNLLDPSFLPGADIYDVIFCRNVLIYFDQETQDRAMRVLRRLLKDTGTLFVGSAETGLALSHGFASTRMPLAFAFRKSRAAKSRPAPSSQANQKPPGLSHKKVPTVPITAKSPAPSATAATSKPAAPARAADTSSSLLDLAEAARLADLGRLEDAGKVCAAHVRAHGTSAQACYLLGLIRNAAGAPTDAVQHFRKALYLDPNHYESLAHLTLLLDKQGDVSGAQVLRKRLQRLAPRAEG